MTHGPLPVPFHPVEASDRLPVPEWAITFADMMSLLLTFFVLIASYSYTDAARYRALAGSLRSAFGQVENLAGPYEVDRASGPEAAGPASQAALVEARLMAVVRESGAGGCDLVRSSEGVRLRIAEGMMFDLGKTELRPEARPFLDRLVPVLARFPGRIWIEGHTDDLPIQTPVYPSNWELSSARAANVVRALIGSGKLSAARLAAVGYADTRPLEANADAASRGRNRRVEIFLQEDPTLPR